MFKKKDIAIAVALSLSLSQVAVTQNQESDDDSKAGVEQEASTETKAAKEAAGKAMAGKVSGISLPAALGLGAVGAGDGPAAFAHGVGRTDRPSLR